MGRYKRLCAVCATRLPAVPMERHDRKKIDRETTHIHNARDQIVRSCRGIGCKLAAHVHCLPPVREDETPHWVCNSCKKGECADLLNCRLCPCGHTTFAFTADYSPTKAPVVRGNALRRLLTSSHSNQMEKPPASPHDVLVSLDVSGMDVHSVCAESVNHACLCGHTHVHSEHRQAHWPNISTHQ